MYYVLVVLLVAVIIFGLRTKACCTLVAYIICKLEQPWVFVGKISKLYIYPVKSCHGQEVHHAICEPRGLTIGDLRDRSFMIIDPAGRAITLLKQPAMVLITPTVADGILNMSFGEKSTCSVNLNDVVKRGHIHMAKLWMRGCSIVGYDCGDAVSKWISLFLHIKSGQLRLLYFHSSLNNMRKEYPTVHLADNHKDNAPIFQNDTAYTLVSLTSLDDLKFTRNDRPNIVVEGVPKSYDEDHWTEVKIGKNDVHFTAGLPFARSIAVNPERGEINPFWEPLQTLKKYRFLKWGTSLQRSLGLRPAFGIHMNLEKPGLIKIGDEVYVRHNRKFSKLAQIMQRLFEEWRQ